MAFDRSEGGAPSSRGTRPAPTASRTHGKASNDRRLEGILPISANLPQASRKRLDSWGVRRQGVEARRHSPEWL